MNKFHFLFLLHLSFILTACTTDNGIDNTIKGPQDITPEYARRGCIESHIDINRINQAHRVNLYGIRCFTGTSLLIETIEGNPISTSHATNPEQNTSGLQMEGDLEFINEVYQPKYRLITNQGDNQLIPWLKEFLPENHKDFFGSENTKYHIVFEVRGDYLVLFKASENINDLPYIERTSLEKSGRLYMAPFVVYPVEYCNLKNEEDPNTGRNLKTYITECGNNDATNSKYIRVNTQDIQAYNYLPLEDKKLDLFPAKYFFEDDKKNSRWFYNAALIEYPSELEHEVLKNFRAYYVELQRSPEALDIYDVSGDVEEKERDPIGSLAVKWKKYKKEDFKNFEEEEDSEEGAVIARPYIIINFPEMKIKDKAANNVINFLVSENYISFTVTQTMKTSEILEEVYGRPRNDLLRGRPDEDHTVKRKISLLRERALNTKNFIPKKWFEDDNTYTFGVLPIFPTQANVKLDEFRRKDHLKDLRIMHFNTHINTEEEKRTGIKTIRWHFSKDTDTCEQQTDPELPCYRDIAKEAVRIWDRAFEIITVNSDTRIRVELSTEDKDLGDLRYNIINLVQPQSLYSTALYGIAPSFAHPDTGQIIGTTSNVMISTILRDFDNQIRNYIRYEIFQKHKDHEFKASDGGDLIHVVSPYIRRKIEDNCAKVMTFVQTQIQERTKEGSDLNPGTMLSDQSLLTPCAKKISKDFILATILHEMGHSFGLGHNFKASVDENNYYQYRADILNDFPDAQFPLQNEDELSKTSSVMDYISNEFPTLTVLGKYDLAALRYLYMDQVENKNREFLNLNIHPDPDEQQPLSEDVKSQMKNYEHCSDSILHLGNSIDTPEFLCMSFDYGSTPEEIVNFEIDAVKRSFNNRYYYDIDPLGLKTPIYMRGLVRLQGFYAKWIQLRSDYFNSLSRDSQLTVHYALDDSDSIERYQEIIEGKYEMDSETDYNLYYPIREKLISFYMDFMFLKSMKCEIKSVNNEENSDSIFINLNFIKEKLMGNNDELYVEDCNSEKIMDFFNEIDDFRFAGQHGVENFVNYYAKGEKKNIIHVYPLGLLPNFNAEPLQNSVRLKRNQLRMEMLTMEPDFFQAFEKRLLSALLNEDGKTDGEDFNNLSNLNADMQNFREMRHGNTDGIEKDIYKKHLDNWGGRRYPKDPGHDYSFHRKIILPMKNEGIEIEEFDVPFLTQAFGEYCRKEHESSEEGPSEEEKEDCIRDENFGQKFQGYLIEMSGTVERTVTNDQEIFIIPLMKGSYIERIFGKITENLEEIQELEDAARREGRSLNLLDEMKRKKLEDHNWHLLRL